VKHPVHLHRHTFEVTKVGDKGTTGLMKDTLNMVRMSPLLLFMTRRYRLPCSTVNSGFVFGHDLPLIPAHPRAAAELLGRLIRLDVGGRF
jgi:hypothetical protein